MPVGRIRFDRYLVLAVLNGIICIYFFFFGKPFIKTTIKCYIKGVQKTVDIFLGNFYNFQYFTVILHGDLGLEVRKYPVKFRNDISTQTREILILLEGT